MQFEDQKVSTAESLEHLPAKLVLTLGLVRPIREDSFEPFQFHHAANLDDALHYLATRDVAVFLIGPRIGLPQLTDVLSRTCDGSNLHEYTSPPTIVLFGGSEIGVLQDLVDAGHIYYIAREEVSPKHLWKLLMSGARHFELRASRKLDPISAYVDIPDCILGLCSRLPMQTDLPSAARLLIETGRELLHAKIVQCFVYEPDTETLRPADASEDEKWTYSAASGLVAFAARTGERVRVDRVSIDPRYDSDVDAPVEMSDARFLAEPIIGWRGAPSIIVAVVRSGEEEAFSCEDIQLLALLAECSAPTFNQILVQTRVQALLTRQAFGSDANVDIFRREAWDHHLRSWNPRGNMLQETPAWLRRAFWVMLAVFFATLLSLACFWNELRNMLGKVN
jgi:hypothetical protein